MLPDSFLGIQLGSVARQPLQLEASSRTVGQKVFYDPAAVYRRAIPDHQELARNPAQKLLEESHHLRPFYEPILLVHVELALQAHGADHRKMVVAEGFLEPGRLTYWGIPRRERRQQVKAALVHKYCGGSRLQGPFFSSGHRSSFQCLMASSSRWSARRVGFCRLKLKALSRRLTCAGW